MIAVGPPYMTMIDCSGWNSYNADCKFCAKYSFIPTVTVSM